MNYGPYGPLPGGQGQGQGVMNYGPYGPVPGYPYAGYPGYNGYYAWQPVRPRQDGFRLAVVIISLIGSILAALGGLACAAFLVLFIITTTANPSVRALPSDQYFNALMTFTAFALAGIVGGGFSTYHSIRGLLRKRSTSLALPWFW